MAMAIFETILRKKFLAGDFENDKIIRMHCPSCVNWNIGVLGKNPFYLMISCTMCGESGGLFADGFIVGDQSPTIMQLLGGIDPYE